MCAYAIIWDDSHNLLRLVDIFGSIWVVCVGSQEHFFELNVGVLTSSRIHLMSKWITSYMKRTTCYRRITYRSMKCTRVLAYDTQIHTCELTHTHSLTQIYTPMPHTNQFNESTFSTTFQKCGSYSIRTASQSYSHVKHTLSFIIFTLQVGASVVQVVYVYVCIRVCTVYAPLFSIWLNDELSAHRSPFAICQFTF